MPETRGSSRRAWLAILEGVAVTVVACAVYGVLTQVLPIGFYRTDGPDLLWHYWEIEAEQKLSGAAVPPERLTHQWHVGYYRALDFLRALFPESSLYRVGELLSALGVGVAVGAVHGGGRLLEWSGIRLWGTTGLFGLSPSVLLFGTVVELHGPFLMPVGLAFLGMAAMVRWPRLPLAILLGVLFHGAFLLHSTGLVLPALLLPWFLALRWQPGAGTDGSRRRDLTLAGIAGAVPVALFFVMPRLLPAYYGAYADLSGAAELEARVTRPQGLEWTGDVFLQEWVVSCVPVSLFCWVALADRRLRGELLALCIGMVPLLYLAVRQLVFEVEYGAYLLPLLIPAARLSAAALPAWGTILLLVVSAGLGVQRASTVGDWPGAWRPNGRVASIEAEEYVSLRAAFDHFGGDGEAWLLVSTHRELTVALAALGGDDGNFFYLRQQADLPAEAFAGPVRQQTMLLLKHWAAGRKILMTSQTRQDLRRPRTFDALRPEQETQARAAPKLLALLERFFEFQPHEVRGRTVYQLVPKPRKPRKG